MRRLKTIFACMLMAIFSVGQVWGATTTYQHIFSAKPSTGNNVNLSSVSWNITATQLGNYNSANYAGVQLGTKSASGSITLTSSAAWGSVAGDYKDKTVITEVRIWMNAGTGTPTGTVTIGGVAATDDGTTVTKNSSASSYTDATCVTYTPASTGNTGVVVITVSTSSKAGYICAIEIDCEEGGEDPTPSLSVTPTSWDFGEVAVSDVADKEFLVSGSNLTAGTLSIAVPEGFSVSPSSITVSEATLASTPVTVSKNTTTIDDYSGNLSFSGCGLAEAKNVALEMSVVADPEPTGTFNLYSGDIAEGDYVIYYSGKAMKNVIASNRFSYLEVTPSENKIVNPDEAIVWHIAASGDYWTLYNAAVSKYASTTTTNNQGALADDTSDDKALWSISGASTYEFINKGRASVSNKYLRNNTTYGFAVYGSGMGGALTLYKKSDGTPDAPTFSPAAGSYLEAQSVTISAVDGASIYYTTDGSTPTTSSSPYSSAIPVSATTTIKAIAVKDAKSSSPATATYTITTPLSVAAAIALIPNANDQVNDQFVEGYVCTAAPEVLTGGKMTYYISADGSETNRLQIYKGKNLDNADFSDVSDLAIGDKVIVFGQLKNYSGTPEMNDGNYIVRRTAKGALSSVVVSGTPTKTAYSSGDAFEPAGLVVTATYASGYAVNVASELAAGDWSASPATVTENGNISVTATYSEMTSTAYDVPVTIVAATLESITLSYDAVEVYQGKPLPKPVVTAHWSDATESDVSALAEFDGYDASTTGEQLITVSYTFGGDTEEENYTVTVNPIYNVELAASVAKDLIETVVGNTESTSDMIVRGIVSQVGSISSASLTYYISDDGTTANQLEIYKGKYLDNADFTNDNKLKVGDEVVVTGKVIYYNNSTAEFANGKSAVTSLARTPNFSIADIASFEVGSADLVVADLTITQDGEGAVTLPNDGSDNTDAVTIVEGKLHAVAVGTATITANLAANGIYKAASTTFSVSVVAPVTKYAISFDGNGADGGDAPDAIADKAAGAEVTLPANSYTKTGYAFDGWKVYDENEDEVTVIAGVFEMPASDVTIKAQWTEIPVWAYTYTSNVSIASSESKQVTIDETDYSAAKSNKGASATITLPQGVTTIHLHLVAWKDEAQTVSVTGACFNEAKELAIAANDGVSGGGAKYDLGASGVDYYFSLTPDNAVAADEVITITAASNKRFVLFGVNQEGGIIPELQSLAISGDLENKEYEAGQSLNMAGLTVMGTYNVGDPVDVTDQVEEWLYDALQVGDESVTISAKIGDVTSAGYEITGLTVTDPTPTITVSPSFWNFNSVEQGAAVAAKAITVTLKNVAAATVAISGTGASAYSVDETALTASGTITITPSTAEVGSFNATVTISDDASVAASATVTLLMTVNAVETPVSTTSEWIVAEAEDLVDGKQVLITGVKDEKTYAMGGQNSNNRAAVEASIDGEGVLTPGENTMAFTLEAQEGGTFALRASNGNYLYAASSGSNHLKSQATVNDNAKWTLSVTSAVAESSSNRNVMQFNTGSTLFSCYASAGGSGMAAIKLYVPKPEVIRDGLSEGTWGTICPKQEVKYPTGAAFYTLTYKEVVAGVPYKVFFDEIPEGASLEAGKPYLFVAESDAIRGVKVGAEVSVGQTVNGLVGVITNEEYLEVAVESEDVASYTYYIINNNQIRLCGVSFRVPSERAYINMSAIDAAAPVAAAPGRRRLSIGTGAVQSPTGLDAINADAEQAQKLIIDGKLYIIRGGHVYNPAGQLVK